MKQKPKAKDQITLDDVHSSHDMTDEYTDIRSPAGTSRFYGVRKCKKCEAEKIAHPAGRFTDDELTRPCGAA